MTCWDILQLAPTQDMRAIKKAYAVLLKQNRPDDNPDGFQRLHAAYQDALNWAEDAAAETIAPDLAEPSPMASDLPGPEKTSASHVACEDSSGTSPLLDEEELIPEPTEAEKWEAFLDEQWDEMVQKVEAVLNDPAQCNDLQAWQFLTASEALLDIDFKGAFAMRFMQRLLQMFKEREENTPMAITPETVRHLNQLFWWSERRNQYDDYLDAELVDDFMLWWQAPVDHQQLGQQVTTGTDQRPRSRAPSHYGNYYVRWLAMFIDCCGLAAVGMLSGLLEAPHQLDPVFGLLTVIFGYPLFSALFEMSPLQATPGKYWCRLQVCDPEFKRIGLFRALLRAALFAVSIYFVYLTVIVNLLIWDGRLVHDRLSRTIVIKR